VKDLTPVQRFAVVVSAVILVAFAAFVAVSMISSGSLPIWAVAGIAAFFIALVIYPLIRRTSRPPRDAASNREDPR
jgi:phosphate/sulfate permease